MYRMVFGQFKWALRVPLNGTRDTPLDLLLFKGTAQHTDRLIQIAITAFHMPFVFMRVAVVRPNSNFALTLSSIFALVIWRLVREPIKPKSINVSVSLSIWSGQQRFYVNIRSYASDDISHTHRHYIVRNAVIDRVDLDENLCGVVYDTTIVAPKI